MPKKQMSIGDWQVWLTDERLARWNKNDTEYAWTPIDRIDGAKYLLSLDVSKSPVQQEILEQIKREIQ